MDISEIDFAKGVVGSIELSPHGMLRRWYYYNGKISKAPLFWHIERHMLLSKSDQKERNKRRRFIDLL